MMGPLTRSLGAALLTLALAATAACSDDAESADDNAATTTGSNSAETPTITIVTYSSYVLDEEVQAKVEKDLGVKLEISATGDGAEALTAAILTAGRPEGDIFFGVDNTLLSRAVAGNLFVPLDPADVSNLAEIPEELLLDESGQLVPIDVGPVCVDYDQQWFAERGLEPPVSLQDLTDPKYRDLLVVQSPVTSTPGLVFLMATHALLGDDADAFWQGLVDNGVSVAGSWDDAWYSQYTVSGGDRPLVVSYASSPPAEVFYSEGAVTTPRTAVIETTCADQVEFAGVLDGSKHVDKATEVINAMLDIAWQESLPLTNFVYPARPDAAEPDLFTQFAPRPAASTVLDPAEIDERRDEWIDDWRSIVE